MRGSLTITSSESRPKSPIDANKELIAQLDKLKKEKNIKLEQLRECRRVSVRCSEVVDRRTLHWKEAQRMVGALACIGAILHRQDSAKVGQEAEKELTSIKQDVQILLRNDIVHHQEKVRSKKAELDLVADLEMLAEECEQLHAATSRDLNTQRIREIDKLFGERLNQFSGANQADARQYWLAANTKPFEDAAALQRFPFDGPSTHLLLQPLGENHSAGSGERRRVPIWGFQASNWRMIGMLLKEREALRQQLDAQLNEPLRAQAHKPSQTRAHDGALLPYMVAVNDLAKKAQLNVVL